MAKARRMSPKKDNGRRTKKKASVLTQERIEYVDYKDASLMRRFVSDRAKIRARRVSGNSTQQQSTIARAVKNAREMAIIPYTNRVTTQRGGARRDKGDRRVEGPAPRPSGPPPSKDATDTAPVDAVVATTTEENES